MPHMLGMAWGIELEEGGAPGWLHCVPYIGKGIGQYVLDLTGQNRSIYEEPSPLALRPISCVWIGAAVFPADRKAIHGSQGFAEKDGNGGEEPSTDHTDAEEENSLFDAWYDKTKKWIRALNMKDNASVVEVTPVVFVRALLNHLRAPFRWAGTGRL